MNEETKIHKFVACVTTEDFNFYELKRYSDFTYILKLYECYICQNYSTMQKRKLNTS